LTVLEGREEVTSRAEVLGDGAIRGKKPLAVSWGLESLHALLRLASRLVGIFRTSVEVSVLPVFHARQDLALGSAIAL
jgi:hypothetical protein